MRERERIGKLSIGTMGKSKQCMEEEVARGILCVGMFSHDLLVLVSFRRSPFESLTTAVGHSLSYFN